MEVCHGVTVSDPYRWLEAAGSPEVIAWTDLQGAFARAALDAVPGRSAIRRRLSALFSIGVVSPPTARGGRYFYQRREGAQEQPVLRVREGPGKDRVLLDPAQLSADAASALDWYYPSPDGRLLAYGLSEGGSEKSTLRVREVETGRDLPDVIPWTRACSLDWQPEGSGFLYTRYPEPGRISPGEEDYHRWVFEHTLGEDWRRDPLVFGEGREPEDWPSVQLSPDGRFVVVSVARGWTRTDVYVQDRARGSGFVPLVEGIDSLFGVIVRNDRLYLHTNLGAARYRLLAADPEHPGRASWQELIPEGPDVLEGALVVGRRILVHRLRDASSRLTLHDLQGSLVRELELPGIGTVEGMTGEWNGEEAFFGFSSFTIPPAVFRLAWPEGSLTLWERVESDLDQSASTVRFLRFPSRDGTPISLFLIQGRSRTPGGPAVLTGYGGFGVSLTPTFGRSLQLFLEKGGLYAVAHLRGGGEYGEPWHRAGMREHKQDVFDDFLAAAEFLIQEGHVARGRLAIMGGSNGGLLVGAALTQRPELFAAVVCQVPLLDMLRYHLFRIARLWIPEYGSPDDPEAFRWLSSYSPYHRVVDGVSYPAVLLTTGESDSRVDPMHARKMAARLQAATSSDRPILLRVETRAGHGQGKPVSKLVEEWTDTWSFLFAQLGMEPEGALSLT